MAVQSSHRGAGSVPTSALIGGYRRSVPVIEIPIPIHDQAVQQPNQSSDQIVVSTSEYGEIHSSSDIVHVEPDFSRKDPKNLPFG